jgi:arginine/ornithine transport system ATP-binding protein
MSEAAGDHAALEVVDLHKSFGEVEVIRGVSMSAHKGDVISILGASGSGKSTFLRCINLLEIPTSGDVFVAGEKIRMMTNSRGRYQPEDIHQVERLRARLGMVFQSFNLWSHMTVIENVIEAPVHVLKIPKAEAVEQAEALLQKVGILERKDYYPAQLSGGQQQRVAIARGLAMNPEVMLFDEPTSALDPELVGEVLKVMRDLADEGRTMLVVTHEMGFARDVSSEVVFLHEGKVEEQGEPRQMFTDPNSDRFRQFLSRTMQ